MSSPTILSQATICKLAAAHFHLGPLQVSAQALEDATKAKKITVHALEPAINGATMHRLQEVGLLPVDRCTACFPLVFLHLHALESQQWHTLA